MPKEPEITEELIENQRNPIYKKERNILHAFFNFRDIIIK